MSLGGSGVNIQALHQIEITSRCNLRCRYCTHPKMTRSKMDMDRNVYTKSLEWVARFVHQGTQREVNLAGIGESTMHPDFIEYVGMAREIVGDNCMIALATNGVALTEEMAEALLINDVWTWVSLHRPEKAGPAVELLKRYGVLKGVSADPSVAAIDWAGQVNWYTSAQTKGDPCQWLTMNRAMVMSDGRITQCCLDAEGLGVMGHVNEAVDKMTIGSYVLCDTCHLSSGMNQQERVA